MKQFTLVVTAPPSRPYLDDANPSSPAPAAGMPALDHAYPRTSQHELLSTTSPIDTSKYDYVNVSGQSFPQAETIWNAANAAGLNMIICRHISGHEYQSYTQSTASFCSKGFGFKTTGPTTIWNPANDIAQIYAGHWLYEPGTTLTQPLTNSGLAVSVADASRFQVGQYVCIYNAPFGSFNNAEHAEIATIDTLTNTLTLTARGFKSTATAHASGSIIAQHVQGQGSPTGTDTQLWAMNFSTRCPVDGNNRQWNDLYAEFLATYYDKYKAGQSTTARILGVHLDTDFYFDLPNPVSGMNSDCNNDGVLDLGRNTVTGENYTGDGLDTFYRLCAERMPTRHLVAGIHDARGFDWYNGVQEEVAWDYGNGDFTYPPKYKQLNSMFAMYLYNTGARRRGPPLVQCLSKTPTLTYPMTGRVTSGTPTNNRPARMGLALTLMEQGYYGTHSLYEPDAWYDEYAVDRVTGAAVPKSDLAAVYANKGWLGQPTGKFRRVLDTPGFDPANSLISNGTFETGVTGWTAAAVIATRDPTTSMDGAASMKLSTHTAYKPNVADASIRSEALTLAANGNYTICFSAKATVHREVSVTLGSLTAQRIFVGPTWRRYVMGFKQATASTTAKLIFQLGRENTEVWLDSIYVLPANANVFRRDFQYGIALANATPDIKTIALGGTFRKILGTQDPAINNGQSVTSVTLDPWDGILLLR